MPLLSQLVETLFDVVGKAFDEHHRAHLLGRGACVALTVEQALDVVQYSTASLVEPAGHAFQFMVGRGIVQGLAPFHLLHQELGGHRRVALGVDRRAAQLAQVGGALEGILQALVGLVDAHRPLHGHALRSRTLGREAIGMHLALQLLPAGVERRAVLRKLLGHSEQREIRILEIHTLNDSPQPQRSRSFGLLNLKPSFRPSRTKSSCVPSMYARLLGSTSTLTPWFSKTMSSGPASSTYSSL